MQIAHFTNTYLPVINGVVRSVSTFRTALTELGHVVFVFAQEDDYSDKEPFIIRYPSIHLPLPVDIPAVIPMSRCVDILMPALKLDLIHSHHPVLLGQAASAKAEELGLPLVFTFHTQYQEYTHYVPLPQEAVQDFIKGMVKSWLMEYMRHCQHIVIPSESMREIVTHEYGLVDGYTVIPTGIDLKPYKEAEDGGLRTKHGWKDDKVMISVGRLGQEKNWRTLLKATDIALRDHPGLRLVVLGDGPERKALEKYSRELGIAERVAFVGLVPFEEVPAYLKAADLFAFASITETQGLVTMEAIASGLPVAAVDAIGTRDVIDNGKQGILTSNDAQELASAIKRLLEDKDIYMKFKSAALEKAEKFDMMVLAQKLVNVYEQAIEDKNHGRFITVEAPGQKV